MNIKAAFQFIITEFEKHNIPFALIGGFALEHVGVVRATMDIDLLVPAKKKEVLKKVMQSKGYQVLHESDDVINFTGNQDLGRVDVLLAHRKYALAMLERANSTKVMNKTLDIKVIAPEDQIGLKVQAIANDSERRLKDTLDIHLILRENKARLNMEQVREYFKLFEMEEQLDNMLRNIN